MPRPSGWYRADGKPNLPKLDREATKKWWISLLEQAKQHDQPDRMAVKIERWLARNDLFYLLTIVCKRQDIDRDWLFERCREVQLEPNGYLDLWAREHGKMQALSEPTPTPDGWKLHGDLVPGDAIFGPDGKVCHVLALNEIVHGAECYEIEFDDGFKIKTGAEHLWSIERTSQTG